MRLAVKWKKMCVAFLAACMSVASFGALHAAKTASAEAPQVSDYLTEVPEKDLQQLQIENGTFAYAKSTGNKTVRFTVNGSYTLSSVTDFAVRFKVPDRQFNRPNNGSALAYLRFKFKDNDTIYGVTKEDQGADSEAPRPRYTFLSATSGEVEDVLISNGGNNNVGGQLNVPRGRDGTVYIPLKHLRDGKTTADIGNRLIDSTGYENLELEYVELTYSAYRWDFVIGEMAFIKQNEGVVTTEKINATASAVTGNLELLTGYYDNVKLIVNGSEATKTAEGTYEAQTEGGTISVPSDKLFFFDGLKISAALEEGYGITKVESLAEGKEVAQTEETNNANAVLTGWKNGGKFYLRKGNHGAKPDDNTFEQNEKTTDILGTAPLNWTVNVTIGKLVKLEVTGENSAAAVVSYNTTDDSAADGKIYLKPNEDAVITVKPQSGYDFRGVKLNGSDLDLADENKTTDGESGRITQAKYTVNLSADGQIEFLGLGDETQLTLDIDKTGGSVSIDGNVVSDTSYTVNIYKTLAITATPEKGYAADVTVIYGEEEGESKQLTPASDGKYFYPVDKAFTLKVSFRVVTYTLTYRLNGGAYAAGESNAETITYFDTLELKNPVKEGYTFKGWRTEGGSETITTLKNVESDLTLIAVFELKESEQPAPEEKPEEKTEEKKSGCSSTVTGGFTGVCALIACGVIAAKKRGKKED
ncbi:MAG: InlB B-repeat-containing protein [Candidatus Borkfalkiaceae bacterium]|nr:InlB B-repeat-containing protein [Clostridia bacterium]MDY6223850.1 InlB B-repeat-containing protein [Christensenellaceae bacterium]